MTSIDFPINYWFIYGQIQDSNTATISHISHMSQNENLFNLNDTNLNIFLTKPLISEIRNEQQKTRELGKHCHRKHLSSNTKVIKYTK